MKKKSNNHLRPSRPKEEGGGAAADDAPRLIFQHAKHDHRQAVLDMSERKLHFKTIPGMEGGNVVYTTGFGWSVVANPGITRRDFWLLNLTSERKKKYYIKRLPTLTVYGNIKCILSAPPTSPECIVYLFIVGNKDFYFCRPDDIQWTSLPLNGTASALKTAVTFEDKVYILADHHRLAIVRLIPHPSAAWMEFMIPDLKPDNLFVTYFVKSCGEIFIVRKYYCGSSTKVFRSLKVWKMQEDGLDRMVCVEVESIGDQVFFLGPNSSTACAASILLGIKGNSICFMEDDDPRLYTFDLEDESLSIHLPFPEKKAGNWMALHWVRFS